MSGFDERKNTAEAKYQLDAAKEFKTEARRNKKLGTWAAELLGMSDEAEIKKYILTVIASDMEEAGDNDVFRKVKSDLTDGGVDMSDEGLRSKMDALMAEAREEIYGEPS